MAIENQISKKYILLDFDDVIFNCRKFSDDLASSFNLSREEYKKCYPNFYKKKEGRLAVYDSKEHINGIAKYKNERWQTIKKNFDHFLKNAKNYVFNDVENFFRKLGSSNLYIVTFGDPNFQKKKIMNSGVGKYIKKTIILQSRKSEAIDIIFKKGPAGKEIFFLDDKVLFLEDMKRKHPSVKTILVKRKEKRKEEIANEYCDFEGRNFREALGIIK